MKRVMIKVSGEALGNGKEKIDILKIYRICYQIKKLHDAGLEVVLVPGGGNIWRGRNGSDIEDITSDMIGMASTLVNAYVLSYLLIDLGVDVHLTTNLSKEKIRDYDILDNTVLAKLNNDINLIRILSRLDIENYNILKTREHLSSKRVVVIGGGLGTPGFTTDMTVILESINLRANLILFGKSASGVFDCDPNKYPSAQKIDQLSHSDLLKNQIGVGIDTMGIMDIPAMGRLCEVPIETFVFDIRNEKVIEAIIDTIIEYPFEDIKKIEGSIIKTLV